MFGLSVAVKRVARKVLAPVVKKTATYIDVPVPKPGSVELVFRIPDDHPFFSVNFPQPLNDDPWHVMEVNKCKQSFIEMYSRWGFFSICEIDKCRRVFNSPETAQSREAYSKLRTLHCIQFDAIPQELHDQIPGLINIVFNTTYFDAGVVVETKLIAA